VFIWYIFSRLGIKHEEKSGNPAARRIKATFINFACQASLRKMSLMDLAEFSREVHYGTAESGRKQRPWGQTGADVRCNLFFLFAESDFARIFPRIFLRKLHDSFADEKTAPGTKLHMKFLHHYMQQM
jgi:hypothetical protein